MLLVIFSEKTFSLNESAGVYQENQVTCIERKKKLLLMCLLRKKVLIQDIEKPVHANTIYSHSSANNECMSLISISCKNL